MYDFVITRAYLFSSYEDFHELMARIAIDMEVIGDDEDPDKPQDLCITFSLNNDDEKLIPKETIIVNKDIFELPLRQRLEILRVIGMYVYFKHQVIGDISDLETVFAYKDWIDKVYKLKMKMEQAQRKMGRYLFLELLQYNSSDMEGENTNEKN